MEARDGAIFHLITLDKMRWEKGEFLHFDFFIAPRDIETKMLPCYVPIREPIVSNYSQVFKRGTPFRSHPVSLEGITDKVWVVASKHTGKVVDKAIFVCM
jgi:hypothetical protein